MATSPSKKKPMTAPKKAPVAKPRAEDTMSEKDKAYFRRKMQEEEMMRKMGTRYDEIMPNPEFAKGGAVRQEMRFPPSYDEKGRIENRIKELDREARKLRQDVEKSSSYSARMMQTLGHLAGKKAGEASDYSIRKRENMKEEMAEGFEEQIKDYKNRLKNLDKDKKKMAVGGAVSSAKVGKVMKEFKEGTLHSGKGGKVVKDPKQAVAIAMSQAQRAKKK